MKNLSIAHARFRSSQHILQISQIDKSRAIATSESNETHHFTAVGRWRRRSCTHISGCIHDGKLMVLLHRCRCLWLCWTAVRRTRATCAPRAQWRRRAETAGDRTSSVVSSEISGGKFPEIYSVLSGNFLSPMSISCFQVQHCCKINMFLTNNSPYPYASTVCIMFRKITYF